MHSNSFDNPYLLNCSELWGSTVGGADGRGNTRRIGVLVLPEVLPEVLLESHPISKNRAITFLSNDEL